jgi:hypothetical protein
MDGVWKGSHLLILVVVEDLVRLHSAHVLLLLLRLVLLLLVLLSNWILGVDCSVLRVLSIVGRTASLFGRIKLLFRILFLLSGLV